jgi:hypothetical protein
LDTNLERGARAEAVAHFGHDKKIAHVNLDDGAADQFDGDEKLEPLLRSVYDSHFDPARLARVEHGQYGWIIGGDSAAFSSFRADVFVVSGWYPLTDGRARFLKLDATGDTGFEMGLDKSGKLFR